jgi:hypothetical protein
MNANEIFRKTMPFVWAKLLLGIATIVVSALILAILLGIAWLFKSPGVGFFMVIIWLALTGIVRFILNHYIGFLIKAGHIAVITEAVTTGKVPDNQVAYGKQAVKERFATSNIYFILDKLVAGAVRQIQRVVGKVTDAMSAIPGMGAVTGLAQFFVSISLGYIDECCLGYTFYKKEQKAFKSGADGVVIYWQNIKALLASAAKTMLFVVLGLAGITLVMFLIFGALTRILHLPSYMGFIGFVIAIFIAIAIKYAFMDSVILIRTMVTYMSVAPTTELKFDLYANLCKLSAKFRELFNKGREEEGQPPIEAAPAASTPGGSITSFLTEGAKKLTGSTDSPAPATPVAPVAQAAAPKAESGGDTVFCRECGTKNPRSSKFCASCGKPMQ